MLLRYTSSAITSPPKYASPVLSSIIALCSTSVPLPLLPVSIIRTTSPELGFAIPVLTLQSVLPTVPTVYNLLSSPALSVIVVGPVAVGLITRCPLESILSMNRS